MKKGPDTSVLNGSCEAHSWPDDGLAERIVKAAREAQDKGGFNVCGDCINRARKAANFPESTGKL